MKHIDCDFANMKHYADVITHQPKESSLIARDLKDKTMNDKSMYISNDDKQNHSLIKT